MTKSILSGQWFSVILLSIVVVVAVVFIYRLAPVTEPVNPVYQRPQIAVAKVKFKNQSIPLRASGFVAPAREYPLVARSPGLVIFAHQDFREGGYFLANELLLKTDSADLQRDVARLKHSVSAAELHLEEVRAKAGVARQMNEPGASSLSRYEPQLHEAVNRLAASRVELNRVQQRLQQTEIRAPIDGRLRRVGVSEGQYVMAGERLASIYSEHQVEIRLPVRDAWLALLDIPLRSNWVHSIPATLHGDYAGQQLTWEASLVRREGGLGENQMITLVVAANTKDQEYPLEPGLLVEVTLQGQSDHLLRLPRSVLADANHLWVVNSHQRLEKRWVDILHTDDEHVWISDGLTEGENVVLSGIFRWLEGTLVNPVVTDALLLSGTEP